MSIIRTLDRSADSLTNQFRIRGSSVLRQWGATPAFVGNSTGVGSGAGINIVWNTATQPGDVGIMVLEQSGADTTVTPSGWTHVTGSPVVDVADATGSKLSVLWAVATASSGGSSVAVADGGDHVNGSIYTFRGVSPVKPVSAVATQTKTVASTTVTWPDLATVHANNMIVLIASRPDDSASTANFSGYSNVNLTGITETQEYGSTNGDGGGFVVVRATYPNIGSIGSTTATSVASTTNACLVLALQPTMRLPA